MKVGLVVFGLQGYYGATQFWRYPSERAEQPVLWMVELVGNTLVLLLVYGTWRFRRWTFTGLVVMMTLIALLGFLAGAGWLAVGIGKIIPLLLIVGAGGNPDQKNRRL
jgi:hypothetical protein